MWYIVTLDPESKEVRPVSYSYVSHDEALTRMGAIAAELPDIIGHLWVAFIR